MQKNILTDRQTNFDLLRIICTIAVVMIHVSGFYKAAITDEGVFDEKYLRHVPTIVIYNTLSRFAVPCFMMLSGAFLLANDKNAEYRFFIKSHLYI